MTILDEDGEEAAAFDYTIVGATIPVSLESLFDAGVLRRPEHTAWMWPVFVPFPTIARWTDRLAGLRSEVTRRLDLARTALTDPDALEGDDDW